MGPFQMVAYWCWYRGEHFHGYQQQQGVRTVQGELLAAFARAGLTRNPVVAGRTDRGVSARMQVLSSRLERDRDPSDVAVLLEAQLPHDLGIHLVRPAAAGFHAAFSASTKEYRYALQPEELGDLALLIDAIALVPGTRDYRVFHFKSSQLRPRTITSVELLNGNTLRFVGEGFARHMVRMLVGGLLAVSRQSVPIDVFREGLERQRNFYCPTAPPEPLTLYSVDYPRNLDPFTAADRQAAPESPATLLGTARPPGSTDLPTRSSS